MPGSGEKTVFQFGEDDIRILGEVILLAEHPSTSILDLIGYPDPYAWATAREEALEKAQRIASDLSGPDEDRYDLSLQEFQEMMERYEQRMLFLDMDQEMKGLMGNGYADPEQRDMLQEAGNHIGTLFDGHDSFYSNYYVGNSDSQGWRTRSNEIGDFITSLKSGNIPYLVQRSAQLDYNRAMLHAYDDYANRTRRSEKEMLNELVDAGTRAGLHVKGRGTDMNICALAYAKYKNPEVSLEDLIKDEMAVYRAASDFISFIYQNPIHATTKEVRDNSIRNLAAFYRSWDETVKQVKIPDFSDDKDLVDHARTNNIYFQMDEGMSGTRRDLDAIPEFVEAYGGKKEMEQAEAGSLLMNEINVVRKRSVFEDDLQTRVMGKYLLDLAGRNLAGKTWVQVGQKLKNGVFTEALGNLTDPDQKEIQKAFAKVSEEAVDSYLKGGSLPIDERILKESVRKITNGIGVLNSRDYFEIYPAAEEGASKAANADRRMEMYRSRGKLAPGKQDTREKAEKRTFGAEQFRKYMKQIDSALYPDANGEGMPLMRDAAYEVMGIKGPEDLIYIDGKPAKQFVKEMGYKEEDLRNCPEILQAEIAAAMTGARSHVDILVPDTDEKGVTVMKARELRTDLRDLNGKEHMLESSRSKRADGLYQDKKRQERLQKLGEFMTAKRNKDIDDDMKKKALTDILLVGQGARFRELSMEGSFVQAREDCRQQAEEIYAEAMSGNPDRLKQAVSEYKKASADSYLSGGFEGLSKDAYDYMKKTVDGAELLDAAFGHEMPANSNYGEFRKSVREGISAVAMRSAFYLKDQAVIAANSLESAQPGEVGKAAGVSTLDRGGSFLSNVTAWIRMKEPDRNLTEIWKDPNLLREGAREYLDFLKKNPAMDEDTSREEHQEHLKNQAEFFKHYRKDILSERFFDISDPQQRKEHALESQMRRDMAIDCNQSEEGGLSKESEYAVLYGGQKQLFEEASAVVNIQMVHKIIDKLDDVTAEPMGRAVAKFLSTKYGPVLDGMDGKDMAMFFSNNELDKEYNALFMKFTMSDDQNIERKCAAYLNGGAWPMSSEETENCLSDYFKSEKLNYRCLDQMKEDYKSAKRARNQRKMSFEDVSREFAMEKGDKQKEGVPARKRSNSMKSPARQELKLDEPGKKK